MTVETVRDGGFGLYVHWPFCQAKCPYCDFNSHVAAHVDQARWTEAFRREIARVGAMTADRRLDSVFFGGGTPSLMEAETVAAILDAVRATWSVANDWEVTLEANPTSVEARRFAGYRDAGVNRISMGVQALDDGDLRRLGRMHTVREAQDAFGIARGLFDRVSFDLIYARQDQTMASWRDELRRALDMAIDHLSLYQLTIEQGTAFFDRKARGGLAGLPDEDLAADLYEETLVLCKIAGFGAYEVSNFARGEAVCRHNLIYWSGGEYAGIGPGAHGRLMLSGERCATEAVRTPGAWITAVEAGDQGVESVERLSAADMVNEYLMMGLRTQQGVSRKQLVVMGAYEGLEGRVASLQADGLLEITAERMVATASGRIVLNAVLRELLV